MGCGGRTNTGSVQINRSPLKMKILFHFRVRGTGAEGVHIAGMSSAFQELGHEIKFVSPTNNDPRKLLEATGPEPSNPSFATTLLHRLADRLPQPAFEVMEMIYSRIALQKLRRCLPGFKPDLIYERHAFFNTAGAKAALRHGIPLVLELNELAGLERVRGQFFRHAAKKRDRLVLRSASLVSAVSPLLARMACNYRKSPNNVITIPNGVFKAWVETKTTETQRKELRAKHGLPPDALILGFVGGLVPWHGFDFLFGLFARLAAEIPNLWLALVGAGPLFSKLHAAGQDPDMQGRLILAGARPYWQTREYMDIFDVAIIPHANEFRSPIKLFEYMGAGRAIVAPSSEPIASVVRHEREALLFEPKNLDQALSLLRKALRNPSLRNQLGEKARSLALRECLWEHRAKTLLEAFEQTRVRV